MNGALVLPPDRLRPGLHIEFVAPPIRTPLYVGRYRSPFGPCLLAHDRRALVWLAFFEPAASLDATDPARALRTRFAACSLQASAPEVLSRLGEAIFGAMADGSNRRPCTVRLRLHGSAFELALWRALLEVPAGDRTTYGALARRLGTPRAARAIGRALGANPVSFLVPCHRVVRADGLLGGYRWGATMKQRLLDWERAQTQRAQGKIPSSRYA